MRLLHLRIGPDFVHLNAVAGKVLHLLVMELFAAGPDLNHETHDRIPVGIGHPLGGTDGIALSQGPDDLSAAGERTTVHLRSYCKPDLYALSYTNTGLSMGLHTWISRPRQTSFFKRLVNHP
jgi:hypothetical protein